MVKFTCYVLVYIFAWYILCAPWLWLVCCFLTEFLIPLSFPYRPDALKLPRSLMFPKKGLVFDSVYVIDAYAAYVQWKSMVPPVEFTDKTKVW